MEVHNLGPSTTELLSVRNVCSPGFQTCYDYGKLAGSYFHETFVLPPGKTFKASISRVCVIAITSCKSYLPVANNTYYLQVLFKFADGGSVLVPVSAMANNTWSQYPTAIMGIGPPSLRIVPSNLTGLLNFTVTVNDSLPYGSFTTVLDGYMKPSNAFSGKILANDTGCGSEEGTTGGNNQTFTADCSEPVPVTVNFSTVLTAITSGRYYSLVVRDTTDIDNRNMTGAPNNDVGHHYTWFALWLQSST